jgi:hypothetical protein
MKYTLSRSPSRRGMRFGWVVLGFTLLGVAFVLVVDPARRSEAYGYFIGFVILALGSKLVSEWVVRRTLETTLRVSPYQSPVHQKPDGPAYESPLEPMAPGK